MKKRKAPKIFKSYPEIISIFVAIFISGLLISEQFTSELYIAWLGISISSFALSFFLKSSNQKTICLIIASLTASMFYGAIRYMPESDYSDLLILDNSQGCLKGRYTGKSTIQRGNKIVYNFENVTYDLENQSIPLLTEISCRSTINQQRLYPDQYYTMFGTMKIQSFDKNPIFEVASFTNIEPELPSAKTIAKEIQYKIKHALTTVLKKEHAGIIIGFILGDTSLITDKSIFVETGISHLLAISGQHIMIIIFIIASILHWFKIPPISRSVLISILLAFYAMITIGSPSIWRALLMYICVAVIFHIESASSPIRPVSIAAFIMLLYDPSLLKNGGFILSFTAVLSIIFLREPFEFILSKLHLPTVLARYISVTFAANLGTMPMVAYLFGTVSLSALFVNPLILWTFTFILPIAFFIAIISIVYMPLAIFLSPGLSILLDYLINFVQYIKNMPGMYFYVGNINSLIILFIYSLMLFAVTVFNKWQIKYVKALNYKPDIARIPTKALPEEKSIQIRIESTSKATPTLLGKTKSVTKPSLLAHKKPTNPFKNSEIVSAMDSMISPLKRIAVNSLEKSEEIVPINNFNVDSQNLYYRLLAMNKDTFIQTPERLLQAHIFSLAIIGYELLGRINSNLNPPLTAEELTTEIKTQDRYLTVAIIADNIMNSYLSERISEDSLRELIENGKELFNNAQKLLQQILSDKNFENSIEQHMTLRKELIQWCWEFIQCDNALKQMKKRSKN